jgi:hypothetical protein
LIPTVEKIGPVQVEPHQLFHQKEHDAKVMFTICNTCFAAARVKSSLPSGCPSFPPKAVVVFVDVWTSAKSD